MKHIFITILVFIVVLTSVAYGIGETFQGYPVVSIFVNGEKFQGDIPAINFNGRTMVPVRFVSEKLGSQVNWDGNTQTVYIVSKNQSDNDMQYVRIYTIILDTYRRLADYKYCVNNILNGFSIAIEKRLNQTSIPSLEEIEETRDDAINLAVSKLNELKIRVNDINSTALVYNIDISDMNTIINELYIVLEHIDKCLSYLTSFNQYGDNQSFDNYLLEYENIYTISNNAWEKAMSGYNKYYYLILMQ